MYRPTDSASQTRSSRPALGPAIQFDHSGQSYTVQQIPPVQHVPPGLPLPKATQKETDMTPSLPVTVRFMRLLAQAPAALQRRCARRECCLLVPSQKRNCSGWDVCSLAHRVKGCADILYALDITYAVIPSNRIGGQPRQGLTGCPPTGRAPPRPRPAAAAQRP